MNKITMELLNTLDEYTASCTVVIASTNGSVPHGSGVAVKYDGQYYILTAAHVLRGEPDNEKIRVIGKPDSPLQMFRGKQELADAIGSSTHVPVFSEAMDQSVDLITTFDYPEETCDPLGMSGCGAWSIPKPKDGEIWSAHKTQLLGILRGIYRDAKVLRFVRIERVLRLLTTTN